jgi:hypothetical protein
VVRVRSRLTVELVQPGVTALRDGLQRCVVVERQDFSNGEEADATEVAQMVYSSELLYDSQASVLAARAAAVLCMAGSHSGHFCSSREKRIQKSGSMEPVELYILELVWQQLLCHFVGLGDVQWDCERNAVATVGNQPIDELVCCLFLSSLR